MIDDCEELAALQRLEKKEDVIGRETKWMAAFLIGAVLACGVILALLG